MHIFNAVVSTAPTIRVSRVGEWCIIGLFGNELVGKDAKAVCFAISNEKKRTSSMLDPFPTYAGPLATNCLLTSAG